MMQSFVSSDDFFDTEIDDKLGGTLALGKIVVVTGSNGFFTFSIGALVKTTGTTALKVTSYVGTYIVV